MRRLRISANANAEDDLLSIVRYIADQSGNAMADAIYDKSSRVVSASLLSVVR